VTRRSEGLGLAMLVSGLCLWAAPAGAELGEIQYDTGVLIAPSVHPTDRTFGNRFERAVGASSMSGAVLTSGSVTRLTFYLAGLGGTNAFLSVFGPVSGTAAPLLHSVNVTGLEPGWNTYTFSPPVAYTGASFLAGVWNRNTHATTPVDDALGLDSATRLGQGHQGFSIDDLNGTGFTPLPMNAMVRAFGNVLPPELATGILRVTLAAVLVADADESGLPSPGDTLRYTASLRNEGSVAAEGVQLADPLDPNAALVAGSVTTTRGTVIAGNGASDDVVAVDLGSLAAGGDSAIITFDAVVNLLPPGVTELVAQSTITGDAIAAIPTDDPAVDGAPGAPDPTVTVVTFPLGAEQKHKVKLRFDRVGKDKISVKVNGLVLRDDFDPAGADVVLDVGGNVLARTLDAKARFRDGVDSVRLKQRKRDGSWKLRYKRRSGDFAGDLLDEGLDAADHTSDPVSVDVRVTLGGVVYAQRAALTYKTRPGSTGTAK
jgi:uncharacterized repeat protein (TIGR01451 family)